MTKKFISRSQYVVYRDRKGRTRKFSPRLKLTAEIRSKKTKRRLKWISKKPRYFTRKQVSLYHKSRRAPLRVTEKRGVGGNFITLKMNREIASQIPNSFAKPINAQIEIDGYALYGVHIITPKQEFFTSTIYYDQKNTSSFWKEVIRTLVTQELRRNKVRTSPKAISKKFGNTYWKKGNFIYYRSIRIALFFRGI